MAKAKKKSKKKGGRTHTGASPYTLKELDLAAHYFAISNMCKEPRKMTRNCIMSTYYQLDGELAVETEWLEEEGEELDYEPGLQCEVDSWMKDLLTGKGYAHDEWTKIREEVEGL